MKARRLIPIYPNNPEKGSLLKEPLIQPGGTADESIARRKAQVKALMQKDAQPNRMFFSDSKSASVYVSAAALSFLMPACSQSVSFFSTSAPSFSCEDVAEVLDVHHANNQEAGLRLSHQLSLIRSVAIQVVNQNPTCEKVIGRKYREVADALLETLFHDDDDDVDGGDAYLDFATGNTGTNLEGRLHHIKPPDATPCWYGGDESAFDAERWDVCCSGLADHQVLVDSSSWSCHNTDDQLDLPLCCDFFDGSISHLRLPALRELSLNVQVTVGDVIMNEEETCTLGLTTCESTDDSKDRNVIITLEQDGFLRPFDVSSILWPAGYLLTLCVASPERCGAMEISRAIATGKARGKRDSYAIELGAGIGSSSIALSLYVQKILSKGEEIDSAAPLVVATDTAKHALALTVANTQRNHAMVGAALLNYNDADQLKEIAERTRGFAVVLGSSLQAFFDNTDDPAAPMWTALDTLFGANNPHAIAVFCHTRSEPIEPPRDGRYQILRRISGDVFNMKTRSGDTSDFEVTLFVRGRDRLATERIEIDM